MQAGFLRTPAVLALEDGTIWAGSAFGAIGQRTGEVVFNTAMTGYQEVLSDPSYFNQIVVMTAPHIGNTGVNDADNESRKYWLSGFVVRAASPRVSNYRADSSLDDEMRAQGIVGITGIDTRALVRHIRSAGAMRGVVSSTVLDSDTLVAMARSVPTMEGLDLVPQVTCAQSYTWNTGVGEWGLGSRGTKASRPLHVVAYDFGN